MTHTQTCIVTGAGGFIGQNMCRFLHTQGYQVVPWMRSSGDLHDAVGVKRIFNDLRPDLVFHLAATPPGADDVSWQDAASNEVAMLASVLDAAEPDCPVVVTGSMAEIGASGVHAETVHCAPDTAYGFAKLAVTQYALSLRPRLHKNVRVARLFGVYGPGESANRLLPFLVDRLMSNVHVPLSDGEQVRDFVYVDDVCKVLLALALSDGKDFPLVNIGSGTGVRVKDIFRLAVPVSSTRSSGLLGFGEKPRRNVDQPILIADTSMLQTLITIPAADWPSSARAQQHILGLAGITRDVFRPNSEIGRQE